MAVGIGFAMSVAPLVLFSLVAVGAAANVTGGAGGPLAVLVIVAIFTLAVYLMDILFKGIFRREIS